MSICRAALLVVVLGAAGACSHVRDSHADGRTTRHVIGFVNMSIPLSRAPTTAGEADAVVVSSLGLSVYSGGGAGGGLVLGYGHQAIVSLGPGACVDLKSSGPCAARHNPEGSPP